MRVTTVTPNEMYPMLLKFHVKAGDCGYTIRQSMIWLEQALRDPYQCVVGLRGPLGTGTPEDRWLAYIWVQLFDTYAYLFQAWAEPSAPGAMRHLVAYVEQWARERGAFTMRGGVSRKWLRALEKRYGYVARSAVVEKRL